MKPLFVLLASFGIAFIIIKISGGYWNFISAGNIAMSIMLLVTAIGHFRFPKGMTMMMPDVVPFKKELVLFSGFVEIAAAIGLVLSSTRHLTSVLLIIFFICILPANINAAIKKVDYEKGTYDGKGVNYYLMDMVLWNIQKLNNDMKPD